MTYRAVYCLWITPDFSEVMAGRAEPPRINHDRIDFTALAALLDGVFHYGPPKTIHVPNDTIDQTTVHTRLGLVHLPQKRGVGSYRCEDFGKAALVALRSSAETVFDVRAAWKPLHYLPDRSFAPPPCGVVFVMETDDFEDNMIGGASLRPVIGLQMIGQGFGPPPENEAGQLPDDLKSGLERIFSCQFERECVVDRIAQDAAPSAYGDILNPAVQAKRRAEQSQFTVAAQPPKKKTATKRSNNGK
jgi:hypothetical protein